MYALLFFSKYLGLDLSVYIVYFTSFLTTDILAGESVKHRILNFSISWSWLIKS